MPKVLIITYYWPPAGGSGVQRWLKMVKYMAQTHWEPIVYTALNPEAPIADPSLENDVPKGIQVIRRKVLEPYRLFKLLTGKRESLGAGFTSSSHNGKYWLGGLAVWIRGNLFIPDARALWVRPSVRFLKKYLQQNPVDIIITTGPPHSIHLIGLGLKRATGIGWIADFRDPWTNIDYAGELMLTRRSQAKHKSLEQQVIQNADAIMVVSPQMANEFEPYKPKRLTVVPNGFDEDDFRPCPIPESTVLTIAHAGTIPPNRNNPMLWEGIARLVDSKPSLAAKLRLLFIGKVDASVISSIRANGIEQLCRFSGYVPHATAIEHMMNSQALLLLVNDSPNATGILTGKLYEYMASSRPILAFGPKNGDLDKILGETGAGKLFQFNNPLQIDEGLRWIVNLYENGFSSYHPEGIEKYSRKSQTKQVTNLMDSMLSYAHNGCC